MTYFEYRYLLPIVLVLSVGRHSSIKSVTTTFARVFSRFVRDSIDVIPERESKVVCSRPVVILKLESGSIHGCEAHYVKLDISIPLCRCSYQRSMQFNYSRHRTDLEIDNLAMSVCPSRESLKWDYITPLYF